MDTSILERLQQAEAVLPDLLRQPDQWTGLFVDYEHPYVERLWLPFREGRLFLHRIHPCAEGQALYHPHPWPSAMLVVDGQYEMAVGYGRGENPPPVACRLLVGPGFRYEMTEPNAWHSVSPIRDVCWTVMVTGQPWERWTPRSSSPLRPLNPEERAQMFEFFRDAFPARHNL